MRKIIVLVFIFVLPFLGNAETTKIKCSIYGLLTGGEWDYKTIVKNSLEITDDEIQFEPYNENGACTPYGKKSKKITSSGGTSLQISAWKCGSNKMYFSQKVILNGLPVVGTIKGKYSRLSFNEDSTSLNKSKISIPDGEDLEKDEPISLSEGNFEFIYSDCEMSIQ